MSQRASYGECRQCSATSRGFCHLPPIPTFRTSEYKFKHGTTLGSHWGTAGRLRYFRPPFQTADGAAIRDFLEQSWGMFTKLKNTRKLGIVIHYILLADRHEQPVEVQLLLAFVALESLKTTYAHSHEHTFRFPSL